MSEMSEELKKDIETNKTMAAISYVWILCLVPLLLNRKSKFAQFHAKQGLLLFVIEIIGWLVFWIPIVGWVLLIIVIALALLGIKNAMEGKYWTMPFIGKYVNKFNL
ncbi:hypothetical protein HOD19_04525 [bacterium]|jgi:uncharacterized membrane protein|nr:hypothetical protein [bacterium]MBT4649009.1 hypothetical protein [bacterium]